MKILIVEDDKVFASLIAKFLKREGFEIEVCNNLDEVFKLESLKHYKIAILDLMLGEKHGIELIRHVKKKGYNLPIIVLSGVSDIDSKIALINSGADDYMTKPVNPAELLARIIAIRRRTLGKESADVVKIGELEFIWSTQTIRQKNKVLKLSQKEVALLKILVENRGMVVDEKTLVLQIWPNDSGKIISNSLQSLVRRVRNNLLDNFGKNPIKNVYGAGYILTNSYDV